MIKAILLEQIIVKQDRYLDSAFGTPAGDHLLLLEIGESHTFDRLHFRNAMHMTLDEARRIATQRLPDKGVEIILYGTRDSMANVWAAALSLEQQGYRNLFIYEPHEEEARLGPKGEWIHAGLWRQSSLVPADHHDTTLPSNTSKGPENSEKKKSGHGA